MKDRSWIVRITDEYGHELRKRKFPNDKKDKALDFASQVKKDYGKARSVYIEKG